MERLLVTVIMSIGRTTYYFPDTSLPCKGVLNCLQSLPLLLCG